MINLHIKKLRETGVIVLYGFFLPKRLCVFRIIFILMDEYYQSYEYHVDRIEGFDPSVRGLTLKDCTYRIYRDLRFSKDKSPYKTHMGVYVCRGGKKSGYSGYYFHVAAGNETDEIMNSHILAVGDYCFEPKVLKTIREDIVNGDGDFDSKDLTHLMKNLAGDDSAELHISAIDPSECSHNIEHVNAVAPSCVEHGHIAYYQCDKCGSKFSDIEGKHILSDEDVIVEPLGHDPVEDAEVLPSATTSGLTKGIHCCRCGTVLQAQEVIPPTENYIIFDCYNGDDY